MIQGEYGDGYQTIVNARYFFGDSPIFFVQRGPLAAIVLWPVEVIVQIFELDPVDVRPHHVFSGLLHSAYLFICWLLLRRAPGTTGARLLAFGAAILCVVFYAYAPYLSHDLLPGLLFLILIFVCHRWLEQESPADAVTLILLGAAVTLIKQTYATFWFALVFYAVIAYLLKWDNGRITIRKLGILTLLATASAAISWLSYAFYVGGVIPDAPLLVRPISLITAIAAQYGEQLTGMFASDLYLRNLPNYGIAAMLLVIPGLILALRGADARMRQIAVCWLIAAVIIQLVGFREARYLAFLAPLTAMLIVPVAQSLLARQVTAMALIAVVLFDQSRGLTVAADDLISSARIDVTRFVNAATGNGDIYSSKVLSFVYSAGSPLARDRYHGIYHLTPPNLDGLYEGRVRISTIDDPRNLGLSKIKPGDRVYYSSNTLVRRPPWNEHNLPTEMEDFIQVAGNAADIRLTLRNGMYEREDDDGSYILFIPGPGAGQQMPIIAGGSLSAAAADRFYGDLTDRDQLQVTAVIINVLCQADSCRYR